MKVLKKVFFRFFIKTIVKKNMVTEPKRMSLSKKEFIGYSISTSLKNNKKQEDIPPFYHDIYDNHKLDKLNSDKELKMYCIFDFHTNKEDFDYFVVVENKFSLQDENFVKTSLPEGDYIQFELLKRNHKTVGMIVMFMREIWIKANGFKERDTPPFIVYDERFHSNYQKFGCKGENYLGHPLAVLHIPIEY